MANAAQKKLAASNAATLQTHRYAVLIINALFILIRLVLRRSSSSISLYIMYALTFALAAWLQLQLESVGRPKFDSKGALLSSGSDLGQAGLTEYMFDILYLTWGIQLLVACTTTWAWWLYLVIPAYAGVKIWGLYKGQTAPQQGAVEQPVEKQSRAQRRAKK